MASILKVNEIQHTGCTSALTIDSSGVVSEVQKEYFQVDLTTDQSVGDNTLATVDFGGSEQLYMTLNLTLIVQMMLICSAVVLVCI